MNPNISGAAAPNIAASPYGDVTRADVADLLGVARLAALRANSKHCHQNGHDPQPVVHLYLPGSSHQWLLTEIHTEDDVAFGLCDLGMGFPELGYVDLREVLAAAWSVDIEPRCNLAFRPVAPLSVYAEQARRAQRIVLSWKGAPSPWPDAEDTATASPVPAGANTTAPDAATDVSIADAVMRDTAIADAGVDTQTADAGQTDDGDVMPLAQFLAEFGEPLMAQINRQTPVVYDGRHDSWQDNVLAGLKRQPFPAQKHRIHACYAGLVTHGLPAVFLNGEMGTGKTLMGICVSALMQQEYSRKPVLVISPPHLVYKWRREILDTVPNAMVHVVNGSNAIGELIRFRRNLEEGRLDPKRVHYLIFGRVRMRMGFYWRPAYWKRPYRFTMTNDKGERTVGGYDAVACPGCGAYQRNSADEPILATPEWGTEQRKSCQQCQQPLWTMRHRESEDETAERKLRKFLLQLPGIGKVSADRLIETFGVDMLTRIIDDNVQDFVNLCDSEGNFVFKDKHAAALEKTLGRLEFALRMISYQPSEYVKRYFPRKAFSLALIDEAHEYKNAGSAQGQAMAVLCNEAEKVLCLTGTLMGGYASDLFYLLFRAMPGVMVQMGYGANRHNSFAAAETRFMRQHGCLIDVFSYSGDQSESFQTARGKKTTLHVKKAPGFGPMGIAQFILPHTVFMRLTDLGEGILPAYNEETRMVPMSGAMMQHYRVLKLKLTAALEAALAHRDNRLTGVVINALLRWPDTCFRAEQVTHPGERSIILAEAPSLCDDDTPTPKEQDILDVCLQEKRLGRRVIVYTTYTGRHDTSSRLRNLLQAAGLKAAVLRSTVNSDAREDWIADQVEHGIDVLITNPELVKTGLDLLAFPSIYFAQTGYNVYTVAQASRRSWRIGQKDAVKVYYACYEESAQVDCLDLMAKKIKTALSTMGVMPETGLDVFDEEESEASLTEALARQLLQK